MKPQYLEVADRICGRLCRDALWSGSRCCWTADRSGGTRGWHGALVPHLYSGTAGIALALWRVAEATGDSICRFTAKGAIARSLSLLPVRHNGYYAGCLGIRHAAAEILGELDEAAILREAEPNREALDTIGGSAGAIAALLDFARRAGRCSYLEMAARHGDLLIAEAIQEADTWAWQTIAENSPLTGFSHGTAGIGWALLELWRATGEIRFREAAQGAFAYERASFHPGGGWPDLRGDAPVYQSVWCHGAGGIAYSRLRAWQILGDAEYLDEARIGLAIVRDGLGGLENFSLCHGSAGNGDLMIYATELLGEQEWIAAAECVGQDGIERYERPRALWPSGLLRAHETPDLMWGTAGIAYFYLRLAGVRAPTMLLPCAGLLGEHSEGGRLGDDRGIPGSV